MGTLRLMIVITIFITWWLSNIVSSQKPIFEKTTYFTEVKEEQTAGFPIIQVRATVQDGSSTTYRLDVATTLFAINPSTGLISVKGRLDREVSDTQRFNVYAKNAANNLESKVEVVVHLSDINDNTPQFSNLPATIQLRENVEIATAIFTVTATDADTSRNALLTYSITKGNQEKKFAVDSYSGKISTKAKLDFESTRDYNLTILVQDSGENTTRYNTSTLRIQIQDHDDQPAKFIKQKYFANVPENSPKGFIVATVKALDLDTAINAPVQYSIYQDSNPEFAFSIDKTTGVIRVNSSIDREVKAKYTLRVMAQSTIFNADYATVEISVSDLNDNRPLFAKPRYDASVIESASVGTTVLRVVATDNDIGNNAEFGYAIVGGDAKFGVSSNGDVYLDAILDREASQSHSFAIVAFETKTVERYDSSVQVRVTVTDANDNAPQFQKTSQNIVYIKENVPFGTKVTKVQAADKDIGDNAIVTYSLVDDVTFGYIPFKIKAETGEIRTAGPLDREKVASYTVTVQAVNSRSSNPLSSNTTIKITIEDVNDNNPFFGSQQYNAEILENMPSNTFVFKFTALDADAGMNANVTYEIISGNTSSFIINSKRVMGDSFRVSGQLRTLQKLDREEVAEYHFIVQARDGRGKNSTTRLTITVIDVNDNAPIFSSSVGYHFYVMEEVSNAFIGQIKATDIDSGMNGNVSFILIQRQPMFEIGSSTGIITCKNPLDFETISTYSLTVIATDKGKPTALSATSNIKVTVLDANDNKPTFKQRLYRFNISENAPAPQIIGYLNATDRDSGANSALTYRILSGNENNEFTINSSNGQLSMKTMLDAEKISLFVLIVSVVDRHGKSNALEDLAAVQINVHDLNDNAPVFSKSTISVTIDESKAVGSVVTTFTATDKDKGKNGDILYSLVNGNKHERFAIDSKSGTVTVRSKIDRDTPSNEHFFDISVLATDMGSPSLSTVAKLLVTVKDSNDNSPVFSPKEQKIFVQENVTIGSIIYRPNCTDIDSDNNGRISFKLVQEAEQGFEINLVNGAVSTKKAFDYEQGDKIYNLVIEARDFGIPSLKSTSKITVTLQNINDNSPQFISSGPFSLSEGNYTGRRMKVGEIKAYDNDTDADKSVYGAISYNFINMSSYYYEYLWPFNSLSSKTTTKERKKNATATLFGARLVSDMKMGNVLILSGSPNYALLGDFKDDCISNPTLCTNGLSVAMWIKFEAGGFIMSSGAQSNLATGFSLSFESAAFRLRLSTNTKEYQMSISSVSTDWFQFAFTWNEKAGLAYYENGILVTKVYTVRNVLRVADAHTKLMLGRPNDADGFPQLFGRFYVGEVVIWKTRLEDYEVMHAYKNSERKTGTQMKQDTSTNSDLFEIDRKTGAIFTNGDIDREKQSSFKLDVKASDNDPIEPKMNYTQVSINVMDVNDNEPKFEVVNLDIKLLEDVAINTQVATLKAADIDAGTNGKITYSIAFGNIGNAFAIDSSNGKLVTNGIIDRETISLYSLQILASDGGMPPRKSIATTKIEVLDVNDEFPQFSRSKYSASVKENLPPGKSIIQVDAIDKDLGYNGSVTYNLSSEYFSINSKDGKIISKVSLDREIISRHTLIVTARDGGQPAKLSAIPVTIDILDENDNTPVFERPSYKAVITENRKVGSSVIQVKAVDSDFGLNGKVSYKIVGGDGKFEINSETGLIKTADNIDREKYPYGFILTIIATDKGNPPLTNSASLNISISDANDNTPVFGSFSYRGKVAENGIGFVVAVVNASDADSGLAGEIQYSITGGNAGGMFTINKDGQIKTAKALDRESKAVYELTIRATDRGGDPKYSEVEVDIEVQDTNDNPPQLGNLPDNIQISEATLVGSHVVTVTATDKDIGSNGMVSFYGYSPEGLFAIDVKTGAVKTIGIFDFEKKSKYIFMVGAYDNGNPRLNSTLVAVNFSIVDSNDNNPVFNPSTYAVSVEENATTGTEVVKVNASENDKLARIGYYIANGNHGNRFSINSTTGLISVSGNLDREEISVYYLLITASDNGIPPRLGQAYVTLTIKDVNDLPPIFQFNDYRAEITENSAPGTSILALTVFDKDLPTNTKLAFKIVEGNTGSAFSVSSQVSKNEFKGIIKTSGRIDREVLSLYQLKVSVSDGIFTNFVNVTIKIKDVNDNFPLFNSSIYFASVFENEAVGKLIVKIAAFDKDEGQNAIIRYAIQNSNEKLSMDRFTGEMKTTSKALDRETDKVYDVLCVAEDSGGLKGYTIVRITILDQNDCRPVFLPLTYDFEIQEGPGSNGKVIATVKATDCDIGTNAKIIYQIKSGNLGNAFDVHPQTGVIMSRKNLDREQTGLKIDVQSKGVYELMIESTDQGNPPLTSSVTAKVNVYLLDINDNLPIFPTNGYSVFISEGALANQDVILAKALDSDSANNSKLSYEIMAGNQGGDFTIIEETGMIKTAKKLERQLKFSYNITVKATDFGVPQLNAKTIVYITIGDTNDNAPVFGEQNYSIKISENTPWNKNILNITATDADTGQNAVISYKIVGGNEDGNFRLISKFNTGILMLNKGIDRETKSSYQLSVMATDGGVPFSRMAITYVSINILDENDNRPIFTRGIYAGTIEENALVGTHVTMAIPIHADDADVGINAKVKYKIDGLGSNVFIIDENSGMLKLRAKGLIDHETKTYYNFIVSATDREGVGLKTTANVSINIKDINDNTPTFSASYYTIGVYENASLGHVLMQINASDPDSGILGSVSYHIVSGSDGRFQVDRNTGMITTQGYLDRESKASYSLNISAVDGGLPPNIGFCLVLVNIADINDITPIFDKTSYDVSIKENVSIGYFVMKMKAVDQDLSEGGDITYSINNDVFSIGKKTGDIKTRQFLDREKIGIYNLIVTAMDGGGKFSNTSLVIKVDDINDNKPKFLVSNPMIVDVFEKTTSGSIIAIVEAADKDAGSNGIIEYSFNGNGSELFTINNKTSIIRLASSLDFASLTQRGIISNQTGIKLNITATDNGSPRLSSSMTLIVNIIDINEENPYFNSTVYHTSIEENNRIGSHVIQVAARKKSLRNILTYSFVTTDSWFNIDVNTGAITTAVKFDRETKSRFILNVKVNDNELPPRFGYTAVVVTVLDANDNSPKFQLQQYKMQIPENSKIDTSIGAVLVTDFDAGNNAVVQYKLTHADIGKLGEMVLLGSICVGALGMENQGIPASHVTSSTTLLEQNKDYSPTQARLNNVQYLKSGIQYQGAWCSGITDVSQYLQIDFGMMKIITKIGVQGRPQSNDYVSSYKVFHSTNLVNWTSSSKIFIGNKDTSTTVFQDIIPEMRARYIRMNPVSWNNRICLRTEIYGCNLGDADIVRLPFQIEKSTGKIFVTEKIDRERRETYKAILQASDNGIPSLNTTSMLEMKIIDTNDNPPVFTSTEYHAVIQENSFPGTEVYIVSANDTDADKNALVTYYLVNGYSKFIIEPLSGVVRVSGNLDYENAYERCYTLQIIAKDAGIPQLTASTNLVVNVTDINDNSPKFNKSEFRVSVSEAIKIGDVFAKIIAGDIDEGTNAKVQYRLTEGADALTINESTGSLSPIRKIDREKETVLKATIMAEDNGIPRQRSYAKVVIDVLDVNDNKPLFTKRNYINTISEGTNLGSVIVVVAAADADSGSNAILNYSILHTNETRMLRINHQTGEVNLIQRLDREKRNLVIFQVAVNDNGMPSLNDTATVTLHISDENDNVPRIFPDTFEISISEDIIIGSFVLKINASDKDEGANAAIKFSLVHGSNGMFVIDQITGAISTMKILDRETKNFYSLVIMASDQGSTQLHGFATVKIHILDVNDNAPEFLQLSSPLSIQENAPNGTSIGQIHATDKDIGANAYMEYSLIGEAANDLFTINQFTGQIKSLVSLDREIKEYYNITIKVNNPKAILPQSSLKVFTIHVLDVNDNAPQIVSLSLNGTVSEASKLGTQIMQLSGNDLDSGMNAKVAFNIRYDLSDESSDFIAINSQTGILTTRLNIIKREIRAVKVMVEISDFGLPYSLNSTTEVKIIVEDVNDNVPEFKQNVMKSSVHENAPNGTKVALVEAFDRDVGRNAEMTFDIIGGNGKGHFRIDFATGIVSVNGTLDREAISIYYLNVSVSNTAAQYQNEGVTKLQTATLEIQILDVNDNPPFFNRKVFTGGVPSSARINTYVMDVKGFDFDAGKHASLSYSFLNEAQAVNFKIDSATGKIYTTKSLVGKSGFRYEIVVSAKDNNGILPYNTVSNYTTARIYVLKESQRIWLVLGVNSKFIESRKLELIKFLNNITQSKTYIESVLNVFSNDGSSKSEIVFHAVDESLGIILEADFIIQKIKANKKHFQEQYDKWKINNVSPVTSKQIANEEIETYVIALIVVGIILGMLLIFGATVFIRLRRTGLLSKVSDDDPLSQGSKTSRNRKRRTKHFSDDTLGWINQYGDWWKSEELEGQKRDTKKGFVDNGRSKRDEYLHETTANLLKQGMLSKRNRSLVAEENEKRYGRLPMTQHTRIGGHEIPKGRNIEKKAVHQSSSEDADDQVKQASRTDEVTTL